MSDLQRLIEAVEAGQIAPYGRNQKPMYDFFKIYEAAFGGRNCALGAYQAYSGSLDAALRLHEALLPGSWYQISHWPIPNMTLVRVGSFEGYDDIPARAWLLAILLALAAKEGE